MSGYPNMEAIAELRVALAQVRDSDAAISRAVSDKAAAERRHREALQHYSNANEKVEKLLAEMDCAQPGNTGYRQRLLGLLIGLNNAALKAVEA